MSIETGELEQEKEPELPELKFSYDLKWDASNWVDSIRPRKDAPSDWGVKSLARMFPDLVNTIKNAPNREESLRAAYKGLEDVMQDSIQRESAEKAIERAKSEWQEFSPEFWPRLAEILDVPVGKMNKEYTAYFTSAFRCPFSRKKHSFMYSWSSDIASTAAHEIMHIEFLDHYEDQLKEMGLNQEQIWHLQEILTVLLTEEMGDLPHSGKYEGNYEGHEESSKEVAEIWRKEKDFHKLLSRAVEVIKKEFPQ